MSKRIYVTFTDKQAEEIRKLEGILGSSLPDVVSTIVAMWLHEERRRR